jgi:hypothetical protein
MGEVFSARTREKFILTKQISSSGEGEIWRVNNSDLVAKIYHSPSRERRDKLRVMIDYPPEDPNRDKNHISFAWPKTLLKNEQGAIVGFLMPEIKDAREIVDIYSPKRRKDLALEVDWRFLHVTALNIASIVAQIHAKGYVIGDIKPQNILVNNRALPSIIDTDSFQVRHPKTGKIYPCLVGSEGFTPPELLDKNLREVEQLETHDRFRLAVIIYYLLFGYHPFTGQWKGRGESPQLKECILQGWWPYGQKSLIRQGKMTIPLEVLPPTIQSYFKQCFNQGQLDPQLRPTALQWHNALKEACDELRVCGIVDTHYYSASYGRCCWCERATELGVDIFAANITGKQAIYTPEDRRITRVEKEFARQFSRKVGITGGAILGGLAGAIASIVPWLFFSLSQPDNPNFWKTIWATLYLAALAGIQGGLGGRIIAYEFELREKLRNLTLRERILGGVAEALRSMVRTVPNSFVGGLAGSLGATFGNFLGMLFSGMSRDPSNVVIIQIMLSAIVGGTFLIACLQPDEAIERTIKGALPESDRK